MHAYVPSGVSGSIVQAFGGEHHWDRGPTAAEFRAMSYLGLVNMHSIHVFLHMPLFCTKCPRSKCLSEEYDDTLVPTQRVES